MAWLGGGGVMNNEAHYTMEVVGAARGLPGAGILAWLTQDQLHPPMVMDEAVWRDGEAWVDGARKHVLEGAQIAGLRRNERVLDIGCGLCGPARLLVDAYDVQITALTDSEAHARVSQMLNARSEAHRRRISVRQIDVSHAWPDSWPGGEFDLALCLNMLHQIDDHKRLFARVAGALVPGGRLVVDDWVATRRISEDDLSALEFHFGYRNFAALARLEDDLTGAGFFPAVRVVDRGEVARGPMRQHFERVMLEHFLPVISREWPGGAGAGMDGARMVSEFIAAVRCLLRLCDEAKLTYRTMVVRTPGQTTTPGAPTVPARTQV